KPLAGVSVQVRGSSRGTTSDANGNYSISAEGGDILTFTIVGYQNQQVKVGKQTVINISLTESASELTDVVISGFQNRKKNLTVGSVAVATAKDLENSGITTFDKALSGKMPGVYVRSVSGRPGETG